MGATKVTTALWNAVSQGSGANTTSTAIDMSAGYGAAIEVKLTNGGTGPTLPAQVQVQTSGDGTLWGDYGGPFIGSVVSGAHPSQVIPIDRAVRWVRLYASGNTGQAVQLDANITVVTGE
jgi:hypothetical protein